MNLSGSSRRLSIALAAALGIVLGGCTMHDRPHAPSSQGAAASTPAMQPDRNPDRYPYRPRSFSDPGPMYPDTGH